MKKSFLMRRPLIVCFLLTLILGAISTSAQSGNLLSNPGFEAPFSSFPGEPAMLVAQGWTPWYVPKSAGQSLSENTQPEYYPASDTENGLGVPRILNGAEAQQFLSFFATHTGGVYQRVTGITSGASLRFSVMAYIWSTSFENMDLSEDDGGVVVQVGIDPTGGTDGTSANIVWSTAVAGQYDSYFEYSVNTTAQGNAVTVFVRSTISAPVRYNNIYLDDASLTVAGSGGATSVPATTVAPVATTQAPTQSQATTVPVTTVAPTATTQAPVATTVVPTSAGPTVEQGTAIPPTNTPLPTNTSIPVTPTMTPTVDRGMFPQEVVYVVQRGDTVVRIAERFGSSIEAVISANGLNANGLIFVGQTLIIPVRDASVATLVPTVAAPTFVPTAVPTSQLVVPTLFIPTPVSQLPPSTAPVSTYVIQPGDTLYLIAVRFNTTITTLARLNNIVNPNVIYWGQRINVPSGANTGVPPVATAVIFPTASGPLPPTVTAGPSLRVYRVQPGDTLYRISLVFGVSIQRLVQLNGLPNPDRIFVGQLIVVP